MRVVEEMANGSVPGVKAHPSLALVDSAGTLPGGNEFDELATPEASTSWLLSRDLIAEDAKLYDYCRDRLIALRTAVRELMVARVDDTAPSSRSVEVLNDALTSAPGVLCLSFDTASGFARTAKHPATQVVEHVMAFIAEDAATLLTSEDATMLAICSADSCDRLFLRTHARRQWCSTRCGDRMRAARAYARKRAALDAQPA